jgi:hypothetical protein
MKNVSPAEYQDQLWAEYKAACRAFGQKYRVLPSGHIVLRSMCEPPKSSVNDPKHSLSTSEKRK